MTDRIEEIRARHQAATPGPWGTSRDLNGTYTIKHGTYITREDGFGSDGDVAVLAGDEQAAYSNGSFIARAREDVPYLLDRVAELEALLALQTRESQEADQQSASVDRVALHDRIAVLLAEKDGWEYAKGLGLRDISESMQKHYDMLAAAVVSVLPTPVEAQPVRGDAFETWLKAQRDAAADYPQAYSAADGLLDLYRLHADTSTPLSKHACEGQAVGDCECLEASA